MSRALVLQQFADHIVTGLGQHPMPIDDFLAGGEHEFELVA